MDWISAQLWKDTSNPSSHHLIASSNWFKALQALAPEDSKIFRNDHWIDSFVVYEICQARETAFHQDIKHREEESGNNDEQWSIIDKIRGVRIADETLCRVFDISSQYPHNRNKNEGVDGELKSSKSMLISRFPNLRQGCDFLCLNLSLKSLLFTYSRAFL